MLGPSYPLYYTFNGSLTDLNNDVNKLLTGKKIKKATKYLKNMNKDFLKIQTFISELIKVCLK